jgi:hypothetical protein
LLLATLRKLHGLHVNLDVRFVATNARTAKLWRSRMTEVGEAVELVSTKELKKPGAGDPPFMTLNEKQLHWLVASLGRGSENRHLPQVQVLNGQQIPIELSTTQILTAEFRVPGHRADQDIVRTLGRGEKTKSGWHTQLQPIVSPDRRFVRLNVNIEHTGAANVIKAANTFNIPDGRTLVWDIGANGDEHLFVLVTPRIIVREEPEAIFMGTVEPIPGR